MAIVTLPSLTFSFSFHVFSAEREDRSLFGANIANMALMNAQESPLFLITFFWCELLRFNFIVILPTILIQTAMLRPHVFPLLKLHWRLDRIHLVWGRETHIARDYVVHLRLISVNLSPRYSSLKTIIVRKLEALDQQQLLLSLPVASLSHYLTYPCFFFSANLLTHFIIIGNFEISALSRLQSNYPHQYELQTLRLMHSLSLILMIYLLILILNFVILRLNSLPQSVSQERYFANLKIFSDGGPRVESNTPVKLLRSNQI